RMFAAEDCDLFDVLAFIAFEQPMIATRQSRATAVRQNNHFMQQFHNDKAQSFIHFVLDRYEESGEQELLRKNLPTLINLSDLGTNKDAANAFGGQAAFVLTAFKELQQ